MGLKTPQVIVDKRKHTQHTLRKDRDLQNTSAKIQDLSPKNGANIWAFVLKTGELRAVSFT